VIPIDFPQSNGSLAPPSGMDNCGGLRLFRDGESCISCWQPTEAEREAIAAGAPVWLWVISGPTQPPVSVCAESPWDDAELRAGDAAALSALGIAP
jgi:hypothetical protein